MKASLLTTLALQLLLQLLSLVQHGYCAALTSSQHLSGPQPHQQYVRRLHRQCPTPEGALHRQLALDGVSAGHFPFRVSGPGPCAPPGQRWLARVRTTLTEAPKNLTWPSDLGSLNSSSQDFLQAVDAASRTSVLMPDQPGELPTIHRSGRLGAFAVRRAPLLGLLTQCERLHVGGGAGDAWAAESGTRLDPAEYSVLHFAYSRSWQLWLRRPQKRLRDPTHATETLAEALTVRVMHEASGACAVHRSWRLARGPDGRLTMETSSREYDFELGPSDEMLRLPTACYRVEL